MCPAGFAAPLPHRWMQAPLISNQPPAYAVSGYLPRLEMCLFRRIIHARRPRGRRGMAVTNAPADSPGNELPPGPVETSKGRWQHLLSPRGTASCCSSQTATVRMLLAHRAKMITSHRMSGETSHAGLLNAALRVAAGCHRGLDTGDCRTKARGLYRVKGRVGRRTSRANINAVSNYGTALSAAAINARRAIIGFLLFHGAEIDRECREYGSALQVTLPRGPPRPSGRFRRSQGHTVRFLIQMSADVNAKGRRHGTALQFAALMIEEILRKHHSPDSDTAAQRSKGESTGMQFNQK
ncbi:hypothetical protein B0H14DRAFT_3133667 [Mycena olivaceomarginata]|nr:hypothetical protein B0H14DRAFT_3133667 [Mycena olivaceomarginata]